MIVKDQTLTGKILVYIFLVILAFICLVPFYIMIINSTHTNEELNMGVYLFPGHATADNYTIIQGKLADKSNPMGIWRGFYNSIIISVSFTALSAFFGAMTAYGFSKFNFVGKHFLFWFILAMMMVPAQLGLIGFYELNSTLGLLDTYWPLIIPAVANIGMVFFVKQYMDSSLPDELIEAAHIDGAGEMYIFVRIALPLSMPSLATMSIFNFVGSWNNYINPLVLINSQKKFPMPVVISMISGLYQTNFGAIYLGISISVVPVIIAFAFLSKYIIGGLTVGSVKG